MVFLAADEPLFADSPWSPACGVLADRPLPVCERGKNKTVAGGHCLEFHLEKGQAPQKAWGRYRPGTGL
ncbi:hypothetical protein [Dethiosulfatarculus sandiegensis]|uniref:Uncharacterized protein n=1 Tax=Dethiosulfatarculus sandiegensis TaxID=1429043 RepID=A0A0D2J370_9BACT|nr:hypothetical protein [Dethiosulfatarculus sandiegensis]KIX12634.1 hypothetical protein X474_18690 [Dethiosulfatarculus sandiegensis]